MDSTQKFISDIEKIKKYERANCTGSYNGEKVCNQIRDLFERNHKDAESLAGSWWEYWYDSYIRGNDMNEAPDTNAINKIAAMQALLENQAEDAEALNDKDFKELCSLTNIEAEDLPIDLLNDLMMIFVDKQAL